MADVCRRGRLKSVHFRRRGDRCEYGRLPATHFRIHEADAFEVLLRIMHVFDFRLRSRGAVDVSIRIMSQADIPELFMRPDE